MNNGIKIIDPVTDARWDAYIARADGGSVFHHSAWKRVIEKTYRARPLYLAACNGAGDIGCGMPFFLTSGMLTGKALVSLPFSDYCDVLTHDAGEFRALWESALDWGREKVRATWRYAPATGQASTLRLMPWRKAEPT